MAVSRRQLLQLGLAPALLARANAQVADLAPTASRVYPGADGRLVYVPDDQGNNIHDASYAGYRGGGVGIPTAPVRETIWPVPGDNTQHIQAAIDQATWDKLFADVTPEELATKGQSFPIGPYFDDILEAYEKNVEN